MELTYMLSPTSPYVMHTQASNILSDNLQRDNRIDVDFNLGILTLQMEITKQKDRIINEMGNSPVEKFLKKSTPNFLKLLGGAIASGNFDIILKTIKTEIVLVTCWNIYSIPFIKFMLNNGKRVVMGGSFCNSYDIDFIRTIVDSENLIIVSGYVETNTDLYKIILDWKDTKIPNTDCINMWTAKNDYIKKHLKILSNVRRSDNTYYSITFNNNCWYNKCKFCKIREEKVPDFICAIEAERLYENIIENLNTYNTRKLLINDNYFLFTDKNKYVMRNLRKNGIIIYVLSGILSFNSKEYLKNINEYVDEVGMGLECANDFSLSYVNKGYTWEDIKRSIENMNRYLSKDKDIRYLSITDLVCKDKENIIENYRNLVVMKDMLNGYGFENINFSFTPLQIFPSVGIAEETPFLKVKDTENPSGMWYVYNYLKQFGLNIDVPKDLMMPFERYDINGNLLLSDFEYIGNEMEIINDY